MVQDLRQAQLSSFIKNLSQEIHKIEYKYEHDDKNSEASRMKYKYCNCFLKYKNFTDDLIEYKCLCWN